MSITGDQYSALGDIRRWYRKGRNQIFELSGNCATGIMDTVNDFLELEELKPYDICYLTYDQRTVVQYSMKQLHCYYLPRIIYKWIKYTNFNTIDFFNLFKKTEYEWNKYPRKKLKSDYKIIIVLDSLMLDKDAIEQLTGYGIPILLLRDPCLIPAPNSYCYDKRPTFSMEDLNSTALRDPINYFAIKVLSRDRIIPGSYGNVHVVTKKLLNLYNLKSSDMTITLTEDMSNDINTLYRKKVKHYNDQTKLGERVICMSNLYERKVKSREENRLRIYLETGLVGYLSKCYYHSESTRFVPCEFKLDWWPEPFKDLVMDRSLIIPPNVKWKQQIEPEEPMLIRYAYSLPIQLVRSNNFDNVTIICDEDIRNMNEYQRHCLYTAITRCNKHLTLCI